MAWRHWVLIATMLAVAGCQSTNSNGLNGQQSAKSFPTNAHGLPLPKSQRPKQVAASGSFKHPFTDLAFPAVAGPFKRTVIFQYDEDGMDISANYLAETAAGKIAATVYIYPVTLAAPDIHDYELADERLCRAIFDSAVEVAQRLYVKPWLRESGDATGYFRGYRAVFDADNRIDTPGVTDVFSSRDGPLTSEVYLNCRQERFRADGSGDLDYLWQVKYRITYLQKVDARALIDAWIAAVPQK